MKDVISLTRAITDDNFYKEMFEEWGEDKNILFVSPQLSGKHLYKTLLPYFCMQSDEVSTAITSLKRFDQRKQLLGYEIDLNNDMIQWADFIVFPFTTQPLESEIYNSIRQNKPEVKIVYSIDFNFYELSEHHPYHDIFSEEMVISDVEDNMFFADLVLTNNIELSKYFLEKFKKLVSGKYKDVESYMSIATLPTMIDTEIVLKNIDYDIQKSVSVNASSNANITNETIHTPTVNKAIEKVTEVAEVVKEKDLIRKEEAASINTFNPEIKEKSDKVKVNKPKSTTKKVEKISTKKTSKTITHAGKSTAGKPKPNTKPIARKKRKRGRPTKKGK